MKLRAVPAVASLMLVALSSCGDAVERTTTGVSAVEQVDQLACQLDRDVVQKAVDLFITLNSDDVEINEKVLVDRGILTEESPHVDVVDGTVIYVGGCAQG
jgi:hypothetical protein